MSSLLINNQIIKKKSYYIIIGLNSIVRLIDYTILYYTSVEYYNFG